MERDILKTGLVLALVCAIAAGSLALTQSLTSSVIAERVARELQEMLGRMLPEADMFEPVSVVEPVEGEEEPPVAYYMGYKGTQTVGAIVFGQATGFGGPLRVLVAVDQSGSILTVNVQEHSETVSIGTKATTPEFLGQFVGFTPAEKPAAGADVDLVQGATISSRAVNAAVVNALDIYGQFVLGTPEDTFDLSVVPDGVYKGVAEGFNGDLTVEVTVALNKITKVEVLEHTDTPEVAGNAVEAIPAAIVEQQHWQVDAVSGATWTSQGIMAAVKNALPDGSIHIDQITDGQYEGEAEGFEGVTKVTVHVAGGRLTDIEVLSHGDTASIAEPAFDILRDAMIEQQTVEVDAVSGATWSSGGFIDAATKALQGAPLKP